MSELHTCPNCGGLTKKEGHLCAPVPNPTKCDYCNGVTESARHACVQMREKLEYVCDACGRMAVSADLLCQPSKLKGC
ncbi:MAG: hypothetical protein HZB55_13710 [Deltaproteobacteria bacterium]|nr:hypothetical protein [Deltaproteobacteria bacterium]